MLSIVSFTIYLEINNLIALPYIQNKNRFISSYQNPVFGNVYTCAFVDTLC